jgi:hypothetical protein
MPYLDAGEKLFRILAYMIGGTWVFFNYKKGRIGRPRLELRLSGDFKQVGIIPVLITKLQIKNISLAKVEIQEYGTAFRVFSYNEDASQWHHLATVSLLEKRECLEPGQPVEQGGFFPVSDRSARVFKIEAILASHRSYFKQFIPPRREKIMWHIATYVT